MEELLARLSRTADREGAVAQALLDDGMRLLVYPLEHGQLVVVGWPAASGHTAHGDTLLHRRGGDMARYGAWLPAQFSDGGWYVARRTADTGVPDADALLAATELLL